MAMRGMLVAMCWLGAGLALASAPTLAGDGTTCPDPAPPACKRARDGVAQAEAAVKAALAQRALWTTAQDALREARRAMAAGEYEKAARSASVATEQAQLGIEQTGYPMFQLPRL
jgi:hypothetical protein